MYNSPMTNIDKFYSDADRLMAKAGAPGAQDLKKLAAELSRLFLGWTRDYGEIGANLSTYWIDEYSLTLSTPEGRKAAVEWFGAVLALLSDCFTAEMDFSDRDWEEIRENVSAEAEDLDMDLVATIMTVIVERGKA